MITFRAMILGTGTAGSAFAMRLPDCRHRIEDIYLQDKDHVEPHNLITCPEFNAAVGCSKVQALRDLINGKNPSIAVTAVEGDVRTTCWDAPPAMLPEDIRVVVVLALDAWDARLQVIADLREWIAAKRPKPRVLILSLSLDRGKAAVASMGSGFDDLCPACYRRGILPSPEPCVVMNREGNPARGDLRRERAAGASHALDLMEQWLDDPAGSPVVNTRSIVQADGAGGDSYSVTVSRPLPRDGECWGAHWPLREPQQFGQHKQGKGMQV